jgi:protein-tyrosine phosphatase
MSCIIENRLWVGAFSDVNTKFLKENQIERILNVWTAEPRIYDGMIDINDYEVYQYDVQDKPTENIQPHVSKLCDLMKESKKQTLVHCLRGTSRSVSVVIGYIMKIENITYKEAVAVVLESREKRLVKPNKGFIRQLKKLSAS